MCRPMCGGALLLTKLVMKRMLSKPSDTEFLVFSGSAIHGWGAFARVDIPKGTRVIEYVGEVIDKAESLRRCELDNHFIFTLDDERDIDGSVDWNPARLINHSCEPNCEADLSGGHVYIVALRTIERGEEVTFNYGYDLADYRDYPCRCGAPGCIGYIVAEEFFEHVRRARTRAVAASNGE